MSLLGSLQEVGFDCFKQLRFGPKSNDPPYLLAAAEEDQRWDPLHAQTGWRFQVIIRIDLSKDNPALKLIGKLFDDGFNHLARAAPRCPKVNDYGKIRFRYVLCEAFVSYRNWFSHCFPFLPSQKPIACIVTKFTMTEILANINP